MLAVIGVIVALGLGEGKIVGAIDRAGEVASVEAIDRAAVKAVPGTIDPATGTFSVGGLALDGHYDLRITFKGGAKLEGVDLSVPRSDFEEEQPLSAEDREALVAIAKSLQTFEDEVTVLALRGNIQNAAILLNKRRTKAFYASKPGEIVWRAEVWRFEKPDETWVKRQDSLFTILYRERIQAKDYDAKSITFDPALGGLSPTKDAPEIHLGKLSAPDPKAGVRFRSKDER